MTVKMLFAKFRLKKWLRKGEYQIFSFDVPLIALSYGLTEFQVHQLLRETGYWHERYTDEFCSVVYYIKDKKLILESSDFASHYADKNGRITITNCYLYKVA